MTSASVSTTSNRLSASSSLPWSERISPMLLVVMPTLRASPMRSYSFRLRSYRSSGVLPVAFVVRSMPRLFIAGRLALRVTQLLVERQRKPAVCRSVRRAELRVNEVDEGYAVPGSRGFVRLESLLHDLLDRRMQSLERALPVTGLGEREPQLGS